MPPAARSSINAGNNSAAVPRRTTSDDFNGAQIQRSVDLAGATAATLSYSIVETGLWTRAMTVITVFFARNGVTFVQVDADQRHAGNGDPQHQPGLVRHGRSAPIPRSASWPPALGHRRQLFIDNFAVNATGSLGVDTINGDAGDDTIIWNANAPASTDGRDIVNGGTEGALGDTFVINGNASAETFNIYTRAAWHRARQHGGRPQRRYARSSLPATARLRPTRHHRRTDARSRKSASTASIPSGTTAAAGGDTFNVFGDFSSTSLRLNTITIDGEAGDDTIDISALSSAHRIVFKSNGGNDTIIGTLRAQDVIELPDGATWTTTRRRRRDGITTLTNGTPFDHLQGGRQRSAGRRR